MMTEIDFSLVDPEVLADYTQRTIVSVQNPEWARSDHSIIKALVLFAELEALGHVPFSAEENADTEHGREFWTNAIDGVYGVIAEYVAPIVLPADCILGPDPFYTMLDNLGKLDAFMAAIETVTPTAKKLTCRNQFNNSTEFTWDMVLMTLVAPKVWGETWQDDIGADWVAAAQT